MHNAAGLFGFQISVYRSDVIVKIGVTFLCPLGKVTKESGIGEAFEARAPAPAYTLPYVPLPWRTWEDFQGFHIVFSRFPYVFPAMRRGIHKGAHLPVAPLMSASFGTFLAETRKVRYH